jgi:3-hydroxyacyl-[acyl-carrier-protein] dehydratase
MLEGDFFTLDSIRKEPLMAGDNPVGLVIHCAITLNPAHRIFKGHFPGNPVVPGVCQVQMVREVAEAALGSKGRIISADNIKFLSMIVPSEHPSLRIECRLKEREDHCLDISATIADQELIFLKFRGVLCTDLS